MGIGICPVFNPRVASTHFTCEGRILLCQFEALDAIAIGVGLPPFSSFGDNREVPEGFEGSPDELNNLLGPWNEWFSIAEGLKVVNGIIQAATIGSWREILDEPERVVEELEELARTLRIAQATGTTFRWELF
jgi:hypothetical protein